MTQYDSCAAPGKRQDTIICLAFTSHLFKPNVLIFRVSPRPVPAPSSPFQRSLIPQEPRPRSPPPPNSQSPNPCPVKSPFFLLPHPFCSFNSFPSPANMPWLPCLDPIQSNYCLVRHATLYLAKLPNPLCRSSHNSLPMD